MLFSFSTVDWNVVTINSKPWMRAREVCSALNYIQKKYKVGTSSMHAKSSEKARIKQQKCIKLVYH